MECRDWDGVVLVHHVPVCGTAIAANLPGHGGDAQLCADLYWDCVVGEFGGMVDAFWAGRTVLVHGAEEDD